jgi:hydroxyacylglutathione hydrolase
MPNLDVHQTVAMTDNYCVLVHDPGSGATVAVDAPDATVISRAAAERGWRLSHVLVTHHHWDHTGGIADLQRMHGVEVVGPASEAHRIAGLTRLVREGDEVTIGSMTFSVLETPGHTLGHVAYVERGNGLAFVGDTLFALGCGRVTEGDYPMMWASLQKIAALPPTTTVFCGHNYTASNARFALSIDPDNAALQARAKAAFGGDPGVPMRLADEVATNPFLRANAPEIRRAVGMTDEPAWKVFGEIRERKNRS